MKGRRQTVWLFTRSAEQLKQYQDAIETAVSALCASRTTSFFPRTTQKNPRWWQEWDLNKG